MQLISGDAIFFKFAHKRRRATSAASNSNLGPLLALVRFLPISDFLFVLNIRTWQCDLFSTTRVTIIHIRKSHRPISHPSIRRNQEIFAYCGFRQRKGSGKRGRGLIAFWKTVSRGLPRGKGGTMLRAPKRPNTIVSTFSKTAHAPGAEET